MRVLLFVTSVDKAINEIGLGIAAFVLETSVGLFAKDTFGFS